MATESNVVYGNIFYENNLGGSSQGYDDGISNVWYDAINSQGNAWSDYSGTGSYSIEGIASSVDIHPTAYPPYLIIEDVGHLPPSPTNIDVVLILATVNSSTGIDSVTLHYRINGGSWSFTFMTISTGIIYEASIGPFTVGSLIEYYESAIESSDYHRETIEDNNSLYYSFIVEIAVIPEFVMNSPLLFALGIIVTGLVVIFMRKRKKI